MHLYLDLAAVVAACGVAAAVQAVTGFGFALVAVPLLALVLDPVDAVVIVTVVGLGLTTVAAHRERAHVVSAPARRLVVGGVLGMPCGLVALMLLDDSTLRIVIATVISGLVVLLWVGARLPAGVGTQWTSGLASGALLTSTGLNGPPLVLTLQSMELAPPAFRGTLQRVFQVQDLAAVALFAGFGRIDATVLALALAGMVSIPAGWAWGDRIFGRIAPGQFRRLVFTTLLFAAGMSVFAAV